MSSHNRVPVGTEVLRDGYMLVKTKGSPDLGQWERWVFKQRLVWELHNGTIPDGYRVSFLDSEHCNCDISNLFLVSNQEQFYLTTHRLRSSDAEITRAGVTVVRLVFAIKNQRKKNIN